MTTIRQHFENVADEELRAFLLKFMILSECEVGGITSAMNNGLDFNSMTVTETKQAIVKRGQAMNKQIKLINPNL